MIISKEELKELMDLTQEAQNTPVIGFSMKQMIEGDDWASRAWKLVRAKWDELGKKYGFSPMEVQGINSQTGEVILAASEVKK